MVVSAIKRKYRHYIAYAKPYRSLKILECICDHTFESTNGDKWIKRVFLNKEFEDENYWKDRRIVAKLDKAEIIERPLARADTSIKYDEIVNKEDKMLAFRVEGFDYYFYKMKNKDFEFYGTRDDTLSYNKKTGKLTFSQQAKQKILHRMKEVVIEKNGINKDLALAILDKELERAGYTKAQKSLF